MRETVLLCFVVLLLFASQPSAAEIYLFLGSENAEVSAVWCDPGSGICTPLATMELTHFRRDVRAIAATSDGHFLVVGIEASPDPELWVLSFDPAAADPANILVVKDSIQLGYSVVSIAMSPDDNYVFAGTNAGHGVSAFAMDQTGALTLIDQSSPSANLTSVAVSPDGRYLAVGFDTSTNNLEILNFDPPPASPNLTLVTDTMLDVRVHSVAVDPSGEFIFATGGGNNHREHAVRYDGTSLSIVEWHSPPSPIPDMNALAISPDGRFIFIGGNQDFNGYEGLVMQFDPLAPPGTRLVPINQFDVPGDFVNAVALTSDGLYLFAGGDSDGCDDVAVFYVDSLTQTLTLVATHDRGSTIYALAIHEGPVPVELQSFTIE